MMIPALMYSDYLVRRLLQQAIDERVRVDHSEREYLRSLVWTDEQLLKYRQRIVGIERRFDRVDRKRRGLPYEPCRHGSYYGPCSHCPPWPVPRYPGESRMQRFDTS